MSRQARVGRSSAKSGASTVGAVPAGADVAFVLRLPAQAAPKAVAAKEAAAKEAAEKAKAAKEAAAADAAGDYDEAYDRSNWSTADLQKVEDLEAEADKASSAAYDAEQEAVANARKRLKPST